MAVQVAVIIVVLVGLCLLTQLAERHDTVTAPEPSTLSPGEDAGSVA